MGKIRIIKLLLNIMKQLGSVEHSNVVLAVSIF